LPFICLLVVFNSSTATGKSTNKVQEPVGTLDKRKEWKEGNLLFGIEKIYYSKYEKKIFKESDSVGINQANTSFYGRYR
jgi:hypothetical protein